MLGRCVILEDLCKAAARCSLARLLLITGLIMPLNAWGQGLYPQPTNQGSIQGQAEENFRQVLVVSAYSAAFGAGLGASMLPFMNEPSLSSVRYVLGGASIGFVLGAAYGFYLVSGANGAPTAPYDYDPYSSMRDLAPAERRVVFESLGQPTTQPLVSVPAYQARW